MQDDIKTPPPELQPEQGQPSVPESAPQPPPEAPAAPAISMPPEADHQTPAPQQKPQINQPKPAAHEEHHLVSIILAIIVFIFLSAVAIIAGK